MQQDESIRIKTIFFITCLVSVISLSNFLNAQEVAPLRLGNIWIYDHSSHLIKISIVDTNTIIDTVVYYKLESVSNFGTIPSYGHARLKENGYYAVRLDTSYPAPNHEKIYWKKNAIIGDTWENPAPDFPLIYTLLDTFVTSIFGSSQTVKHLEIDGSIVLFEEFWTEEFGKLSRSDFGTPLSSLQGCVIDGVVYGDTTFTIVSVENEFETPNSFYLSQNYPNPFNPATNIRFRVHDFGFVSLKVYDILGREIATLVNEEKPAGGYEITFDGSNLVSGIYLYQLEVGNFSETKVMLLIK